MPMAIPSVCSDRILAGLEEMSVAGMPDELLAARQGTTAPSALKVRIRRFWPSRNSILIADFVSRRGAGDVADLPVVL